MGDMKCVLILMLEPLLTVLFVQGQPSLSIEPATWYTGTTLTVTCDLTGIITFGVIFFKDIDKIYTCPFTNSPCSDKDSLSDYSDVDWSQTGKAVFTISKARSTRDDGDWTCSGDDTTDKSKDISLRIKDITANCGPPLTIDHGNVTYTKTTYGYTAKYTCDYEIEGNDTIICQANGSWSDEPVCSAQTPAVLSVQNVVEGETATFECSFSSITSTSSLEISKDNLSMYECANIIDFTCSAFRRDTDYSDVTFTGRGTTSVKGTFTVDNADQIRDGGSWVCKYGSSLESVPVIFVVQDKKVLYWLFLLVVIPCIGLVVVIIIVSGYKTLVISPLYVKVTKNTFQLSWKPEFEHVPDTTYAKCGPNGLTENAELIDGLFVVVFRDLIPERQHDVTVYCQHAEDMQLYKSETCVVFTLKDFSNTHPKERKPVLALHLLDLTVYQRKVQLSWTSPIAFDSTQVEYWFGSEKHITMSANKTSLATSNAELTRLLPERMITFIIIGEKDGTKYPTGLLCQKTLKD